MPEETTRSAAPAATLQRFQVSVTVECTCVIDVRAEDEHDAITVAKGRYVREHLDVEPPHMADWSHAHVELWDGEASS